MSTLQQSLDASRPHHATRQMGHLGYATEIVEGIEGLRAVGVSETERCAYTVGWGVPGAVDERYLADSRATATSDDDYDGDVLWDDPTSGPTAILDMTIKQSRFVRATLAQYEIGAYNVRVITITTVDVCFGFPPLLLRARIVRTLSIMAIPVHLDMTSPFQLN
ncbi:hypothetical protein BT96DRAFT_943466 [Gymnopus androsaceus JB14]|uniref:Uncharacterized protein n=1 Tax=Gymnopus androsaceus JB14 TaxID=1447944 RepID=A0A6A4H8M1_9AGAR|nr:hypothetical protein BT96DRAFT_943466 [Gymnopus androsaceus JB14]